MSARSFGSPRAHRALTNFTPAQRKRLRLAGLPCLTGDNSRQLVTAIFRAAPGPVGRTEERTMKVESLPWEGGCRCGQVRFRISAPPVLTGACHCIGCQRMTRGAFSLAVVVSDEAFEVTEGEPVIGGLHGEVPHYFCPHCMSWMFTG